MGLIIVILFFIALAALFAALVSLERTRQELKRTEFLYEIKSQHVAALKDKLDNFKKID